MNKRIYVIAGLEVDVIRISEGASWRRVRPAM
jgi:hypothetical protein